MDKGQPIANKRNARLLLLVVFGGFFLFGLSENVKGPAIPIIQTQFSLDELQLGLLLSLNSFGYLLACSFTGLLTRKYGNKFTSILAFGTMALSGVFLYMANSYSSLSASYFFLSIGNGILEIALALLGARIFLRNTGAMMNLAHFFYGLSSAIAPIIASVLMGVQIGGQPLDWNGAYLVVLLLCVLPIIPAVFAVFPANETVVEERITLKAYTRDPIAWLIIGILSFGVVSELSIGGWLVNYLVKVYDWQLSDASTMLSAFFVVFMLGRLLLGPLTDKIGFTRSLILFPLSSGLCSIGAVLLGERGVVLFVLAGAGVAPIYPTIMALLAKRYSKDTDTAITFTVTVMGIACIIGNFMVGLITDRFKVWFTAMYDPDVGLTAGLQAGYLFIGLNALLCTGFAIVLYRLLHRRKELL